MKSRILQEDHEALIQLNRNLSAEERLVAFFHHSQLLSQFALLGKKDRKQKLDLPKPLPPNAGT